MPKQVIDHWSYSAYGLMKKCPFAFKLAYIDKLRGPPVPAMERGTTIHLLAEKYLTGKIQEIPNQLIKLKREFRALKKAKPIVEQFWGVTSKWKQHKGYGAWCIAKTDAAVLPTKKENVLIEVDHKTGGIYDNHFDQGSLYAAIGFGLYPNVDEIEVEFFYIDKGVVESYKYTRAQLRHLVKFWREEGKRLMSTKKFLPTPSKDACKWCGFRSNAKLADGSLGPCKAWRLAR